MRLDICKFTHQGGREHNEDSADDKQTVDGERAVFIVADGLGGHRDGELASACVTEYFGKALDGARNITADGWLEACFCNANEAVLALQQERRSSMKSTAVALAIERGTARWGHIGDSRLYCLRDRNLYAYTADHSVAYRKYLSGEIARKDIAADEDQSMLLRCLGEGKRVEAEFSPAIQINRGDAFLLCTDGAWEYLYDGEILIDYLKSANAQEWAERLLLRVISRITYGENDNLTLLAIKIEG